MPVPSPLVTCLSETNLWDWHVHRKLRSMLFGSMDGRAVCRYMHTYGWGCLLSWNYHNTVNQRYSNIKVKKKKISINLSFEVHVSCFTTFPLQPFFKIKLLPGQWSLTSCKLFLFQLILDFSISQSPLTYSAHSVHPLSTLVTCTSAKTTTAKRT